MTAQAPALHHRRRPCLQRLVALLCASSLLAPAPVSTAWARSDNEPSSSAPRNTLPALGDSDTEDLSVGAERKLGDQIMREIRRDPDYLDDPVLLEYLQAVWQPLVAAARARGDIGSDTEQRYAWEPFLVRSRTVNAFALPGGFVGVHLGLIALTTSRDELASVLAHELSHITQRHIARNIANSKRASMLSVAAIILGILAASRTGNADGANAILTGGQAAAIQTQLNFSREMEREADRVGFGVLTQAGFAPAGMAELFEKLAQDSRLNDSGNFPYLRTHPLTVERIGEARSRMGIEPLSAVGGGILEHSVARARSQVLMDGHGDALQRMQELDSHAHCATACTTEKLGPAYASALASTLLHDWARADAALEVALGTVHGEPRDKMQALNAVTLLQAQSLLDRGEVRRAQSVLATLADQGARPLLLLRLQLALASASQRLKDSLVQLQRVTDDLQTWVTLHPNDALAWSALSQAWKHLGHPLRAIRASAEFQLARGDLRGAAERLRAGQRLGRKLSSPADFFETSVIDARLRAVEAQRSAEKTKRKSTIPKHANDTRRHLLRGPHLRITESLEALR